MSEVVLTAKQVYQWIKSGTPAIVKEAENLLRAGKVKGVTKGQMETNKDAGFTEFVSKWKLPVTEGGRGGGGHRGGMVETAISIWGSESHPGVTLARAYVVTGQKLADELTKVKRDLSTGYIRGVAKEKPAEKPA